MSYWDKFGSSHTDMYCGGWDFERA